MSLPPVSSRLDSLLAFPLRIEPFIDTLRLDSLLLASLFATSLITASPPPTSLSPDPDNTDSGEGRRWGYVTAEREDSVYEAELRLLELALELAKADSFDLGLTVDAPSEGVDDR